MKTIFAQDKLIHIVDFEIELSKKLGRMIHTYELLKEMAKTYKDYKFHFVIGADILETIHTWGNSK